MDLTLISIIAGLGLTELLLNFYCLVQTRRPAKLVEASSALRV